MASSNRHWPSLFKSKPQHHQWQQQEHNRTSIDSGCEERNKDPKPRWNPKPEQIRILEAIFNSGMVNPPRDEIRRIRVQLQEFGQVGDANVFYWFQNRKSRSKNKQPRNNTKSHSHAPITTALTMVPPPSSSSNKSSHKPSQKEKQNQTTVCTNKLAPFSVNIVTDTSLNSPTASVNQNSFVPTSGEFLTEPEPEPFFFPVLSGGNHASTFTQGFRSAEISTSVIHQQNLVVDDQTVKNHSNLLLSDLLMNDGATNYKKVVRDEKNNALPQQLLTSYGSSAPTTMASNSIYLPSNTLPSVADNVQGKSTVVINDVRFEVPSGPLNVKEAFGDDAVLIHSSGQPVVTDTWGVTLQPLQHGASYYLVRMQGRNQDLINILLVFFN
ncbi:hypothetical protein DCAR_0831394 [Daucus carota subsp. sativus]|uniref:Protein WUSCHEL n=1 Tax=Daucus carota subsp. sativus TaxID=79200 RepID=A0AAF0XPK0_DAUCS|nr:hypothetical protein DCAR_0831394 [Daucus carota subsp. sativus]